MNKVLVISLFLSAFYLSSSPVQAEDYIDHIARQTQGRMCRQHGGTYCSDRYFSKWRDVASRHCDMIRTLSRQRAWRGLIGGELSYCDGNIGYKSFRFSSKYGDLAANSNNIFYCFMLLNQSAFVIANRQDLLSCQNYIPRNMRNSLQNYYTSNNSPYDYIRELTARSPAPATKQEKSIYDKLDEKAAKENRKPVTEKPDP